jgi:hypothetical protein
MRLMEVGTKQQSLNNKEDAYNLFNQAYDLYCLFWGINMQMLNIEDVKWIEDSLEDVKKITTKVNDVKISEPKKSEKKKAETEPQGALAKMKAFVKKAVDCCIE